MAKSSSKTTKSKSTSSVPPVSIGINDKDRAAIAKGLNALLADTFTLYLTTHNFHWNEIGRAHV